MQTVLFRTAKVKIAPDRIISEFNDGKVNDFWYAGKPPEYMDVVRMYGYEDDWRRYAIEHELAHHFIADNLGWRYSWSLHSSAGRLPGEFSQNWPNHIAWEENLVNAFQHYSRDSTPDKWNTLHMVFPKNHLIKKKIEFHDLTDYVIEEHKNVKYAAENGSIEILT